MKLAVLTLGDLPSTPDAFLLAGGTPPKVGLLPGSNGVRLFLHASVGVVAVRPYYHVNGDDGIGRWIPLGGDGAVGVGAAPTTADAAQFGGCAEGRYASNGEPRYWILIKESGAGTLDDAELDAVDRFDR